MKAILGCQEYPWSQIYGRQNQNLSQHLPKVFESLRAAGVASWEPFLPPSREAAQRTAALLKQHGLAMASTYANVRLHEKDWGERVEATVEAASWFGRDAARVLVVNPEPIAWGQDQEKTEAQLQIQARAMDALGHALRQHDQALAYHIHAPEMKSNARELRWTLDNMASENVGLCLDAHWIYRGAGNSQAALDELTRRYQQRIVSVHLRQSKGGVWSEVLEDGDVDYKPLAELLKTQKFDGPLVIEQAIEAGMPQTMEPGEALRRGTDWCKRTFKLGA